MSRPRRHLLKCEGIYFTLPGLPEEVLYRCGLDGTVEEDIETFTPGMPCPNCRRDVLVATEVPIIAEVHVVSRIKVGDCEWQEWQNDEAGNGGDW